MTTFIGIRIQSRKRINMYTHTHTHTHTHSDISTFLSEEMFVQETKLSYDYGLMLIELK